MHMCIGDGGCTHMCIVQCISIFMWMNGSDGYKIQINVMIAHAVWCECVISNVSVHIGKISAQCQ